MAFMYDAATSPSLALCKQRGAIAMSHYMIRSYEYSSPQPDASRKLGMGAYLNAEGWASELVGATRAKGRSFAEEALSKVERGVPRDGSVSIGYSVDVDLTDLSKCDEAFRGINDVHSGDKTGIKVATYAEGGLIERLHKMDLVQGGQWLSMSEGFGGFQHALQSGLVAAVQMHNARGQWIDTDIPGTDRNTVINPHTLGAWWPAGSPYAGGIDVTPAEVLAVLQSPAGREALRAAIWDSKIADPTDPTHRRTYLARQYLTTTYARSLGIPGIAAQVTKLATGIDVEATAVALKNRLLALLGATPPGGTS